MAELSVIGCGNMGGALVRGLARAGYTDVIAYDVDPEALEAFSDLPVSTTTEVAEARTADIVFLAVKPDLVVPVLEDLDLQDDQTVVSIAAGVPTDAIAPHTAASVARMMPNLAAEWGAMAAAVTGDVSEALLAILGDLGSVVEVDEQRMDLATAINGSGPAFVFYLIRAMTEAGVDGGFDPDDARILAAQTFKGAAEIVLQSEDSLDALIDAVCSPKGTTIEGMAVLRESDVDAVLGDAVAAADRRAGELAQEASQ